ncbi:proteasome activator complex subunit 4B-like [Linepithema humile]|uniref:proteasome activator complex subunit 4B-like n=1 Tax=Linepithema humile TaxID=83485 RepID=UPI00062335FC|nr:PREDICTED: proteasome activator complex subunit 4B-like [Linepithema humile]
MVDKCNRDTEDNPMMSSSSSSSSSSFRTDLGFRPQKELVYNKLLPYADEFDVEARKWLAEIKGNLGYAVMLREIKGCTCWLSGLDTYIELCGMKFSKEDHITFVKLVYELFTIPNLEVDFITGIARTLINLLNKKELISPDELELPWRPLYELLQPLRKNSAGIYRPPSFFANLLYCVIRCVKTYFPLNATQEILDELRPLLCPFDESAACESTLLLECFLPLQLPPKHHSMGYQLWFDEFMTMWKVCHNAPQWEDSIMWLMAKLATHNIGYIDWEPHFPLMFTRFIRCLNLPVTYKQMSNHNKIHKLKVMPMAMWIVAILGNGSSAQMYLEKFLKTIETYLYPANYGRWTVKLRDFLARLPYYFIQRLHKERYAKPTWETPIPDNYKLTDSDVDSFVKGILPTAMTAMYSKFAINEACQALQFLATMRPSLVIPNILERMYSTFDSLTEPHKLTASMISMAVVARPLVQGSRNINEDYTYPEGPAHVLPLLFSSLPGIDPNDNGKCFATFRFISVFVTLIPVVDSSRSTAVMTEDERMICEATSRFEDFVLQFLDRVFIFIDSSSLENVRLESGGDNWKSQLEKVAETALAGVCTTLLMNTSDAIFESALHKLRTFITERILETKVAGQLAAVVCKSFTRFRGRNTLRALVPVLAQTILPLTEGDDVLKEENLDHRLLHAMLILSAICDTPGSNLIPHLDTLLKILDRVLLLKSTDGNKLACRLLKSVLSSLSLTTPYQYKFDNKDNNDPDYPYIRDWGKNVDIDNLRIHWYIPGEEEIAAIQRIFSRYLIVQIDKLKGYCEDSNTLTREELFASLNIVCNILKGSEHVLPTWEEEPLKLIDSSIRYNISIMPLNEVKKHATMPDGSNVRYYLVGIMSQVQRAMLENAEDNTKSFFALIQIWNSLLLGKTQPREVYEARRKNFQVAKRMFEDKLLKNKGRVGPIILERCDTQYVLRQVLQSNVLTETHKRIILELFTLAVSRYADVRSKAQSGLFSVFKFFPFSHKLIIPHVIDILAKDTEKHHDAYKGVLYLLLGSESSVITKVDLNILRSLWPAIVLSKPSEKLSVIRLKEEIVLAVNKHFYTSMIKFEMPDSCLTAARALWKHFPQPSLPQPDENEMQKGVQNLRKMNESNLTAYTGLQDELLRCILEESLHWRHKLMAMGFIRDLVHPDQAYSAQVVRYFLQTLIHDSLEERKIAIRVVIFMLKQQKRKHPKVTVDIRSLCKQSSTSNEEELSRNVTPGLRTDNRWLQYNYETRPLTAEQWDEPRYAHKPYVGYYAWPKILKVHAPSSQQLCLDPEARELTDCEKEVYHFFDNPHNIDKLISYFSLEEKKGKDKFNANRCFLFKRLFRNHGIVHLKHFLPHLQRLVMDKHESSQRCVAEIMAGIIKGAKHWPFQMTCDMWQALLPIIRTAIVNLTEETVMDWGICFATAQQCRDPNRHHWLLECLMEEPPLKDLESSFVECGRLYVLQSALNQQRWRVTELLQRLLVRLEDRLLTNPFQNLRERLGSMLVTVFDLDLKFPHNSDALIPRMQTLIDKIVPRLEQLVEDDNVAKMNNLNKEESLSEKVANVSFDRLPEVPMSEAEEQEVPRRLLKTVCKWIISSASCSQYAAVSEFYQIFPIICQLQNTEGDEELNKMCLHTLAVLAHAFTLPEVMSVALAAIKTMSEHSSWSARSTCLEYLQVLVFHNMGIILSNLSWIECVKSIVLRLLEDDRLEVREKASQVLGGLLHCTFIVDQEKLLEELKSKSRTRLHKRVTPTDGDALRNANIDAIRMRHAAVLGLCAFIRAHPYDVPKYVPPIFEHLSLHMNDPQPIPMTIRKTLSDFKRTHYDGWIDHKQHFTEEQLGVLQDLTVPPTHYA